MLIANILGLNLKQQQYYVLHITFFYTYICIASLHACNSIISDLK